MDDLRHDSDKCSANPHCFNFPLAKPLTCYKEATQTFTSRRINMVTFVWRVLRLSQTHSLFHGVSDRLGTYVCRYVHAAGKGPAARLIRPANVPPLKFTNRILSARTRREI